MQNHGLNEQVCKVDVVHQQSGFHVESEKDYLIRPLKNKTHFYLL